MRQKLQNNKGNAESLEFLPALGLFIFKKSIATTSGVFRHITLFAYVRR